MSNSLNINTNQANAPSGDAKPKHTPLPNGPTPAPWPPTYTPGKVHTPTPRRPQQPQPAFGPLPDPAPQYAPRTETAAPDHVRQQAPTLPNFQTFERSLAEQTTAQQNYVSPYRAQTADRPTDGQPTYVSPYAPIQKCLYCPACFYSNQDLADHVRAAHTV